MAWIESHQALSKHKKTLALAAFLKTDRHKILGHLHELWWWGLDNADVNGRVGVVSEVVIAEAAGWPLTNAAAFLAGLTSTGFMDVGEDGLTLHDWYDYAGKLIERRDENRERMRAKRNGTPPRDPPERRAQPPHDPGTPNARADSVQSTNGARAPATVPNPTQPNRTEHNRTVDAAASPARARPRDDGPVFETTACWKCLADQENGAIQGHRDKCEFTTPGLRVVEAA